MDKMISVSAGFQSSVNIAYDLNDDLKLKNYIPTKSAMSLLEDILDSTRVDSVNRARILIGAYGKGKSHIVLMILAILMKKDLNLLEKMMPELSKENPELYHQILNYAESNKRFLPIVVSGSNNSISQAFMMALQRTLKENELDDIMPSSGYQAAINIINMWQEQYPKTYDDFSTKIGGDIISFKERLLEYDPATYADFEKLYPALTAGSIFNPFFGFGIIESFEEVVKSIKSRGYSGVYIIYDEFSKYLENHISDSTKNDTKILQDMAEKCNRSGAEQIHLMLISHKEITSYLDRATKQMIDGWRGVSERFEHVYLSNNFSQTYEIIASAICKNEKLWKKFCHEHQLEFDNLEALYEKHSIFSDIYDTGVNEVIHACYPLHPVTTFILPRLSERVAQNERTLFTFISSPSTSTLYSFLEKNGDREFKTVTPDAVYDYFEPLLKQEAYSGSLHQYYLLTAAILRYLDQDSLEARLIKTISLIYVLEQFEKLPPTLDELVNIFSLEYSPELVEKAIKNLIEDKYIVYLKRSNNYLRLKETSGVDVRAEIEKIVQKNANRISLKQTLNNANFNNYMFPSRYNDDKEMTRYFAFEFIGAEEVSDSINWYKKSESIKADGVIYAVIPNSVWDIEIVKKQIKSASKGYKKHFFVLPKRFKEISDVIREYEATSILMDAAQNDQVLYEDYEVIYADLREMIQDYVSDFTQPDRNEVVYIYDGQEIIIKRKKALTNFLSDICFDLYPLTPVICNEVINRDELTTTTTNSRNKIISSLLRNELEPNLGLIGSGQEVSIMRSTLIRTGILIETDEGISLDTDTKDENIKHMFSVMIQFIQNSKLDNGLSFKHLYDALLTEQEQIGMRKGLIPIFLAVVFHNYKKQIVISDSVGQVPTTLDTVLQLNAAPELFKLTYVDWDNDKDVFVNKLRDAFCEYVNNQSDTGTSIEMLLSAMRRWYMGLPKYSKNLRIKANGEALMPKERFFIQEFRKNTGAHEFLFNRLPEDFGVSIGENLAEEIVLVKGVFDNALSELLTMLSDRIKSLFGNEAAKIDQMTVTSVVHDWCDNLDPRVFNQLFTDGTDRCLKIFRAAEYNDEQLVLDLGKTVTGLRVSDWDAKTSDKFFSLLNKYKHSAESFVAEDNGKVDSINANSYQLTYVDDDGNTITRKFAKVEESKRGNILHNAIISQIAAMGQSISDQEKRQILMEVLKGLC